MLRVLFDYQHFSEQRYGGISRYFATLMHGIDNCNDAAYSLSALHSQNYYIKELPLPLHNKLGKTFLHNKLKREISWNKAYSKFIAQRGQYNIFHPTYYQPYFLNHIKTPFVITVHDMIHEKFPGSFTADDKVAGYKREVIGRADKVIAISQTTKNDLMEILNIPKERIKVIHHGISVNKPLCIKQTLTLDVPQQFILYVGDRNKYKNFNRFAQALSLVMHSHKNLYLICTGGFSFSDAEVDLMHNLNIIHKCIRLNVADEELRQLYSNALMLVVPSLYEGFGYPVLEAFNAGCPVAASNTPGLAETAGEAVIYFNPYDTDSIKSAIEKLLTDQDLTQALIVKGRERLKKFDLQTEIDATIACYREVAG